MTTAIIQARMGSQRLPGKVMMKILKKPILYFVINQIKQCKHVDKIIVATTTLSKDDVIHNYAKSLGVDTFRGNPSNVLDRYFQCAKKNKIKKILRITADDPLIDPDIISQCIIKFEKGNYDYVSNTIKKKNDKWVFDSNGFPVGVAMEIFNFDSLKRAWQIAEKQSDREHVTPIMINNPDLFKLSNIKLSEDFSNFRVTVDYKEDFIVVKKIIENFPLNEIFTIKKIVKYLKQNNNVTKNNSKYIFMEGYFKSIKSDKK
jgi:spore coat polysaccharide biosynthesis protein SpsF